MAKTKKESQEQDSNEQFTPTIGMRLKLTPEALKLKNAQKDNKFVYDEDDTFIIKKVYRDGEICIWDFKSQEKYIAPISLFKKA